MKPDQNRFRLCSISTAPCRYKSLKMKLDTDDNFFPVNVDGTNFTFIPSDVQLPDGSHTVVCSRR